MKTVVVIVAVLTGIVLGAADLATAQARGTSKKAAERTVVLSVRGMT
jgi:hypothetical protein